MKAEGRIRGIILGGMIVSPISSSARISRLIEMDVAIIINSLGRIIAVDAKIVVSTQTEFGADIQADDSSEPEMAGPIIGIRRNGNKDAGIGIATKGIGLRTGAEADDGQTTGHEWQHEWRVNEELKSWRHGLRI
jgi:hypothetical protein